MSDIIEWKNVPVNFVDYIGFVYIIENEYTHQYYIGQKLFFSRKKLKPLKGKKKSRYKIEETNWKDYWGSSENLLFDIKKYGKEKFERIILYNCKSKVMMNYHETKLQFEYDVLFDNLSYNKMVNCRISHNQVKNFHL